MKKFFFLQFIIVFTGLIICSILKNKQPVCDYIGIESYEDLKKIDASVYMIPEEDAWLYQTADTYIDFFEELYDFNKTKIFDKQILVIEPNDKMRVYNNCIFQNVQVTSVIDGDETLIGNYYDFIYPAGFYIESPKEFQSRKNQERFFGIDTSHEYSEKPMLHLAGLNIMKPGHKYFIFAQSMNLSDDYLILCADRQQYTWMDITEDSLEVMSENSYQKYFDNEIFTNSQTVIDDYYRLKREVLAYYNIGHEGSEKQPV